MKTLLSGDWHLTDRQKDAYRWRIFPWLQSLILNHHIDRFICLGDITEAKDYHSSVLTNQIADALIDLKMNLEDMIIVPGNHDASDPDHPFFEFIKYSKITWISKPTVISDELFLPHTRNYQNDWKHFKGKYARAFCHNTFQGAKNEFGRLMDGIPTSAIPCPIYTGDIHAPQKVDNVTFVGAPYHVRFGDKYTPRVIILDGVKVRSIEVPSPRKHVIELNAADRNSWCENKWAFNKNDMVRFKVFLDPKTIREWPIIQDTIKEIVQKTQVIQDSIIPIIDYKLQKQVINKSQLSTDIELVHEMCRRHQADNLTKKIGLDIIKDSN